jgi:hypothetical protein
MAAPAPTRGALTRARHDDEDLAVDVLLEAYVLDDRPLKPCLSMKYPGQTHAVFPILGS